MSAPTPHAPSPGEVRCTYCKKRCSGKRRDSYGEFMLGVDLPVCKECDEDFAMEDGPWNEVR